MFSNMRLLSLQSCLEVGCMYPPTAKHNDIIFWLLNGTVVAVMFLM